MATHDVNICLTVRNARLSRCC